MHSIKEFYRDQNVFITGGTGFLGKVLIEKLARTCNGINNIYVLMRPKKGKHIQQRLETITNLPVLKITSFYFQELNKRYLLKNKYAHKIPIKLQIKEVNENKI